MSRIENIITTTFRASGGNIVSFLGDVSGRTAQWGRVISENSRMSERLNAQWRAIGTTVRYAIAGGITFGAARMIGQLRDINNQLGQMQALSGIGGTMFSDRVVNQLGNNLQRTALDTITPLNEVNDAAVNFLSTVQNVDPSNLPDMLTQIGQGAKLAQTPIEDLTQAATTFQIAFQRAVDPTTIGQFTRMWAQLIGVAPGGIAAAPTIAQAIPGLASMFQLAPGKNVPAATGQAQLFGLTLGALRTGMPPATAMRGLTYLLQSIAQPTGGARKALAGIGITPQTVEQQGIFANLMRLLNTITHTGNARQLGAIPDDTLDAIDQAGGTLPGIPASEMTRLRAMIPRIHGIRAAIILASQLQQHGNIQSVSGDVNMMLQAQDDNSVVTQHLREAWQKLSQRSRLQEATVAVNTMGIQIAQAFNPVFDFVSSGIALHLAPWMQNHRHLTQNIARGAVGGAAFLSLSRALGLGGLPGVRNLPGIRGLLGFGGGRAFIAEQTLKSAAMGAAGRPPIGTANDPLYVIVMGEVFGTPVTGGPPGSRPTPGGGGGITGFINKAVTGLWAAEHFGGRVFRGGVRASARGLSYGAEVPAVGDFIESLAKGRDVTTDQPVGFWRSLLGMGDFNSYQQYHQALRRAQGFFPGATGIEHFGRSTIHGRAEITMTIDMTDSQGKKVTKRVHVPVDMWNKTGSFPQSRGKAGAHR